MVLASVSLDPTGTRHLLCTEVATMRHICVLQEIKLGEAEVVLTGGTESMSQTPYAVRNARWGTTLGMDLKVLGVMGKGWSKVPNSSVNVYA